MNQSTIKPSRLAEIAARLASYRVQTQETDIGVDVSPVYIPPAPVEIIPEPDSWKPSAEAFDKHGAPITYNSKQLEFIRIAGHEGQSAILIGAAGTGKTTCQKGVVQELVSSGRAGILESMGHKYLQSGTPGVVICAYTRRAVSNIRRNVSADVQNNCITIHKLLEYQPVYYEVDDPETGETKTKMKFEATRHAGHPLPSSIHTIIFEETSMLGTDLYKEVINACPHQPQLIFLGDIQQLPPVFGPAILGFKLLELPVIELTEVYRQALESPIISLAHRILSGNPLPVSEFSAWNFPGQLKLVPWMKKIEAYLALKTVGQFFTQGADSGLYDPEEDMILIPFNKSYGTDELNKIIANHLAHKRDVVVWEIISGFTKLYLSIGDKVMYEKEDATVLDIQPNPSYSGTLAAQESKTLDYWGVDSAVVDNHVDPDQMMTNFLLSQTAAGEDRVNQCSHLIKLRMNDSDTEIILKSAGEANTLALGYCLTVHKAQGSEWRKVFFLMHQSHAVMNSRELLYTAITRAKEELFIICEPDTFEKGIKSQRVKGNTLIEKAEFFKGKISEGFEL